MKKILLALKEKKELFLVFRSVFWFFHASKYCFVTDVNQNEYTDWLYFAVAPSSGVATCR